MSKLSNVYVDISHVAGWSGRMSGIERVEYNIIKHFLEEGARFLLWEESTGSFVRRSKPQVTQLIKDIEDSQESAEAPASQDASSLMARVRRKLASKSPKTTAPVLKFCDEDKVVILDGLWDKHEYIESVRSLADNVTLEHVVYDMIPLVCKGYVVDFMPSVFEHYMKTVLPLCKTVYAISESTAKDTKQMLDEWGIAKQPTIIPFRLGDDILETNRKAQRLTQKNEEYVLAMGTVEVRKNYPLLLYVYGLARDKGIDLPMMYIAGRRGWLSGDFQYIVDNDAYFSQKIKLLGGISDSQLSQLYSGALYAVCPSFYEGWGLPIRESLAYGKVTLSSNTSSLPEAGGSSADYFSQYDAQGLLELMQKYAKPSIRKKREQQIRTSFKTLSWDQAMIDFAQLVADC